VLLGVFGPNFLLGHLDLPEISTTGGAYAAFCTKIEPAL